MNAPAPLPATREKSFLTSYEQLRALYAMPDDLAKRKCLPALEEHSRAFIANSPFLVLSTFDGREGADASPRGDRPGFVVALDDNHLLVPDRPGNNRLDSLANILVCPHVGLLFLIPGVRETLRLNGTARITTDQELLAACTLEDIVPKAGILIEIREIYLHCGKALLRSRLWKPESWPEKNVIASASTIWKAHMSRNPK